MTYKGKELGQSPIQAKRAETGRLTEENETVGQNGVQNLEPETHWFRILNTVGDEDMAVVANTKDAVIVTVTA